MRLLRRLVMSCEQFELRCGADPLRLSPRQRVHVTMCRACRRYADDMQVLEARLRRALKFDVPNERDATRSRGERG